VIEMVVIVSDLDDLNMSLNVLQHILGTLCHYAIEKESIGRTIFVQIDSYFNHKTINYVLHDGIKFW
jgi:hypothetical protein